MAWSSATTRASSRRAAARRARQSAISAWTARRRSAASRPTLAGEGRASVSWGWAAWATRVGSLVHGVGFKFADGAAARGGPREVRGRVERSAAQAAARRSWPPPVLAWRAEGVVASRLGWPCGGADCRRGAAWGRANGPVLPLPERRGRSAMRTTWPTAQVTFDQGMAGFDQPTAWGGVANPAKGARFATRTLGPRVAELAPPPGVTAWKPLKRPQQVRPQRGRVSSPQSSGRSSCPGARTVLLLACRRVPWRGDRGPAQVRPRPLAGRTSWP